MTINEEKINIENSENLFTTEDRSLLVSLLNEYGDKLIKLCEKIEEVSVFYSFFKNFFGSNITQNKYSFTFTFITSITFITFIFLFFIGALLQEAGKSNSKIPLEFLSPISLSFLLAIIIWILLISKLAIKVISEQKKLKILKREAKTISLRLEKIIRIASQIQEHLSPEIPSMIIRVELDLRLADAESALEYYQEMISK